MTEAAPSLREKRIQFTRCLAHLLQWVDAEFPNAAIALGEGYVALTDGKDGDHDGPHKRTGGHYTGLAQDLLLYVDGVYVTNGGHPVWIKIGEYWEGLHPLARWGGRFKDANHVSFEHEGVK